MKYLEDGGRRRGPGAVAARRAGVLFGALQAALAQWQVSQPRDAKRGRGGRRARRAHALARRSRMHPAFARGRGAPDRDCVPANCCSLPGLQALAW